MNGAKKRVIRFWYPFRPSRPEIYGLGWVGLHDPVEQAVALFDDMAPRCRSLRDRICARGHGSALKLVVGHGSRHVIDIAVVLVEQQQEVRLLLALADNLAHDSRGLMLGLRVGEHVARWKVPDLPEARHAA